MNANGPSSPVKTLVIVLLLAVVAVQGYFLWKKNEPSAPAGQETQAPARPEAPASAKPDAAKPATQAGADGFQYDWNRKDTVFVSFTKPLGEAESSGPLAAAPFEISPAIPGEWIWMGPYVLRFKTTDKNGFDPAKAYTFTARPQNFLPAGQALAGRGEFTLQAQTFTLSDWKIEAEPIADKPGWYTLKGRLRFSREIKPQEAAKALTLVDPKLGPSNPVPLTVNANQDFPFDALLFESAPVQGEAKARTFTLLVDKDAMVSSEGVALSKPGVVTVNVAHSKVLQAYAPKAYQGENGGWELAFSAKVDPKALRAALSVEPAVDGFSVGEEYGAGLVLTGNFKPGATYTLSVAKGLTARNGAVLDKDERFSLKTPDLPPGLRFANPGMFLPASGSRNVGVEAVNIKGGHVTIERVFRNNIFFSLNYYDSSAFEDEMGYGGSILPYLGDTVADFDLTFRTQRNQPLTTPVDVWSRVKGQEPGFYRVSLSGAGEDSGSAMKWLLITDLGIAAKRGHDDLLVWVASYKDTAPVQGARVKVISTKNQVLFQGVTDARGLWRATGLANLPEEKQPFIITVEKDADYAFLHFDRFKTDMTGLDVSGVEIAQTGYQAFLWSERDIYRPGETVHGALAVRDTQLNTPPGLPLKLVWTDPQGRELAVENAKTGAQGMAFFNREIPSHAMTGPYVLEARIGDDPIGQYRFEVEDFKPDRISAGVTPQVQRAAPGSSLAYDVEGRYLFGAPAAGLDAQVKVVLTPAPFAPKGLEEYVFGDPERPFEAVSLADETATLGEDGRAAFKAEIPAGLKPPAALQAVITARVSEAGGRGVAARARVPVDAYTLYPGLKKVGENGLTPGQPYQFEYVVVDGLGAKTAAKTLVAELYEDRWQTVLRRAEDGTGLRYETRRDSRLVERRQLADPGQGGSFAMTPPKFGSYRLVLTDPEGGAAAQANFWAQGQGYNPWAMENPARLELVASKTDYMPGETAKLQVRAPFPGKLLLTVESTGVQDVMVVDMPANTAEVSVPVKNGYSPNVYITGVLVRKGADVSPNQAGRAFGSLSLNVAREAGRQNVTILAPGEIRPGTKLNLSAKALPGSTVTMAVVDEGILQLVAQKLADPWGSFYAKRGLEVASFDTWAMLLPEVKALAHKSPAGGDDDMSRYLRTESPQGDKSVAFWSGPLKADAQGMVRFSVDVPAQFQGALRVMVVAVEGLRFGSAQQITRVRSPLVVLPTFPRFAQTGDSMLLPVTVRNDTGSDGQFQVALEATGALSSQSGPQTVSVANAREATVVFPVTAGRDEGVAGLTATASGNGEKYSSSAQIGVRPPLPAESRIQAGSNQGPTVEFAGQTTQGFVPSTARISLRLGRYPVVRYAGKLETLLGYPYGCIEQTVSKSFPLLYFANLARELEPAALEKSSPEAMVSQGIGRVLNLQMPSGGFGMWPGAEKEQPWASVYATHFLLEARKAGHQVPEQAMNNALGWTAEMVTGRFSGGALKTQAYGLYVLARAGKPDRGMMDHMRAKLAAQMTTDAQALLGAAYVAAGNPKAAEPLLAAKAEPAPAPRGDDVFDSALRSRALLLAALVDAAPDAQATAQAARDLTRMLDAAPACSTQESGMAFVALGKLFARQQNLPACTGRVLSGTEEVARFDTARTTLLKSLPANAPPRLELDAACGPGALFYSLDARGVPQPETYTPSANGLELKREFLDRAGKPLDPARITQGSPVVVKTSLRSTSGPLAHVVLSQLLPSGLEVENPRLATTEKLDWMEAKPAATAYADYRADRVNVFLDLPDQEWKDVYTLCRAVIPGSYALPPVRAEAMYAPEIAAGTALGVIGIEGSKK